MALKITIDAKSVQRAFKKAPDAFMSQLAIGMKQSLTVIQKRARLKHRFISRSGGAGLEGSIQTKLKSVKEGGEVFLETGIAIYGPRIHRGFGTWKPDKFLFKAAADKKNEVVNILNNSVAKAIKKAGF